MNRTSLALFFFVVFFIVGVIVLCIMSDPATHPNDYTVVSIHILRGDASKVYDAPTYEFTADASTRTIKGWSVNPTHLGDVLCPIGAEQVARAVESGHCPTDKAIPMDGTWIGTITEEQAQR